ERIGNVVQECLANASIHGSATAANVQVTTVPDGVIVEIADNGSGPGGGMPGLGSAVLNEATGGDWTLGAGADGGSHVRAVLAV
ncbi:MAG: sensor histidine kinase, partial [Gaiellales bacterium]